MSTVFNEEKKKLESIRDLIQNETNPDNEAVKKSLNDLVEDYQDLLDQTVLLTKVSDRLQNKLDNTNEKLKVTNAKLKHTIDLLDELKISRKASTIVWLGALSMFFISELVIEPSVDFIANNYLMGLGLKTFIALLIKPVEGFIEERMKKQRKKEILALAEKEETE
jgi:hypothetical protein